MPSLAVTWDVQRAEKTGGTMGELTGKLDIAYNNPGGNEFLELEQRFKRLSCVLIEPCVGSDTFLYALYYDRSTKKVVASRMDTAAEPADDITLSTWLLVKGAL